MSNPLLLADFINDSFKQGGYISVLSLYSLFVLMTQYNLRCDTYYEQLYSLVTLDTCLLKYTFYLSTSFRSRSKFFELLTISLRSSHISEYIVLSFIKKLARIAIMV